MVQLQKNTQTEGWMEGQDGQTLLFIGPFPLLPGILNNKYNKSSPGLKKT